MPNDTDTRKGSMSDQVYEGLKSDLFSFHLMPGDRFSEGEIATRLRASRTPVREALYRLQREGYVEVLFRSGWRVKPLDTKQLRELFELRLIIERAAIDKLCSGSEASTQLRALLRFQNGPAASTAGKSYGRGRSEACFHRSLVSAAGNSEMIRIHREVTERLSLAQALAFHKRGNTGEKNGTHTDILSALLARNAELAKSTLSQHVHNAQDMVQTIIEEEMDYHDTDSSLAAEPRCRAHKY